MKVFSGRSNLKLSSKICEYLGIELGKINITNFKDQEVNAEVLENIRGEDVFLVQSTSFPANDNLMELMFTIDAIKRASPKRITAVIPYLGYSRADRLFGRSSIGAKVVARMLTNSGADNIITIDLHSTQTQAFFDIGIDNIYARPILLKKIRELSLNNPVIVSPDVGGVSRARAYAKKLNNIDIAFVDKRRPKAGESEVMNLVGKVQGKDCIFVDDMLDSGGTACKATDALIEQGANSVYMFVTHGVLSDGAHKNIKNSKITKVFVTDTIKQNGKTEKSDKIEVLTVADLIGESIRRMHTNESLNKMFETIFK
ncbi:MAG: ribose-phosphate pyrophosphokinase [Proteobacteria bacterium]|nr:ribose-phosphate pyrophosphokinase [Pseudomonadota bacterium]